ncbi:unnamed protein product, partial [Brachionus calyciflorus]
MLRIIFLCFTVSMVYSNPLKGTSPTELKRIFDELDLNKDTYIALDEILSPLSKINNILHSDYKPHELEYMVIQIDMDKDNKLSFNEFQIIFDDQMEPKRIFAELDINNDMFIDLPDAISSLSQINRYLNSNMNLQQLQYMFDQLDVNKDEKLDYNEYYK